MNKPTEEEIKLAQSYTIKAKERIDHYDNITKEFQNIPEFERNALSTISSSLEFALIEFATGKSKWGKHELTEFIPRIISRTLEEKLIMIDCFHKFINSKDKLCARGCLGSN